MLGHIPIIKLRLRGIRPSIVFINDFPTPEAKDWHNPGAAYGEVWQPDHATVQLDSGDRIEQLDFRFVAGLTVSATGSTEARAKTLFNACIAAGAKTVGAVHAIDLGTARVKSGWTDIYHASTTDNQEAKGPGRHLNGHRIDDKSMGAGVVAKMVENALQGHFSNKEKSHASIP